MASRLLTAARSALLTGLFLLVTGVAHAGDFMDTTITVYLGDDNLLAGPDLESPRIGLGNAYPELFFEGLNSQKPKAVTETHLVVYKRLAGFIPGVVTEAAAVIELEVYRDPDENRTRVGINDDGTYLRVQYFFDRDTENGGKNISFTGFPFNSRRFLLGYTYDLAWGSERTFPTVTSPVPGFKLNVDLERAYFFAGLKTAIRQRADLDQPDTEYGVLAGAGVKIIPDLLSFDFGFGYFTRGTFPTPEFFDHRLQVVGFSARLMVNRGADQGAPVDFRLYRNDPTQGTGRPSADYSGSAFNISAEFTYLSQNLEDPEAFAQTVWTPAMAGALRTKLRFGRLRASLDVVYRDVYFLTFSIPGVTPYRAFPTEARLTPQVYGALFLDYFIQNAHVTPGLAVAVMLPASVLGSESDLAAGSLLVVRDANDFEILPTGVERPLVVFSVKGSARWDLSPMMAFIGEVSYTRDPNATRATAAGENVDASQRVFDDRVTNQLGMNLLLQARF